MKRLGRLLAVGLLAGGLLSGSAGAAIQVAAGALAPTLKVDGRGYAEVAWKTKGGARHTLLIPPQGRVLPGGRLPGRDVSRATAAVQIPFKRVLRQTPDGAFWALQAWQVVKGGPVHLRFSRWRGEPTVVTAELTGETLSGAASFQGQPLFGRSPTTGGKQVRIYVYVDCSGCLGRSGWTRLIGVPPRSPDGSYSLGIRPDWLAGRYRVTLAGPNLGWSYTPDASAVAEPATP